MKCTLSGCDRCTVEATTRRRPLPATVAPPKRWWVEFTDSEGDAYTDLSFRTLPAAYEGAARGVLHDDTAKPRAYFAAEPRPFRQGHR